MRRRVLVLVVGAAVAGGWWVRRNVLPGRPDTVPTAPTRRIPDAERRPSPDGAGVRIAVNPGSGPAWSGDPTDELREGLPSAEVHVLGDDDDLAAMLSAPAAGHDATVAIGAAGGDGTLSTAAELAHAGDLVLVAVPSGTFNHLARDLGLDDAADAIAAVRAGTVTRMDLGAVRDEHGALLRTFVNTLSFGGYTDVVDARERLEPRLGKWLALVVALVTRLVRMEPLALTIDGRPERVWLGWIGNGAYAPEGFAPSWREHLDDGLLDIRLLLGDRRLARTRLLGDVLLGRLGRSRVYVERVATEVAITATTTVAGGALRLAVDGETFDGPATFTVAKLPRALAVAVPP